MVQPEDESVKPIPLESYLQFVFRCSKSPQFSALQTANDYFNYGLECLLRDDATIRQLEAGFPEKKDNIVSRIYRSESHQEFQASRNPDLNLVVEHCTKSVAYAVPHTNELSLAFANRSAALFKARLFKDCILDIDRAIDSGYPNSLKIKLLVRKMKCLRALNCGVSKIDQVAGEIREFAEKLERKDPNKLAASTFLNNPGYRLMEKPFEVSNVGEYVPKVEEENSRIPGASDGIEVQFSEKFGRHVIATRDIKPGETILCQKPFAKYLVKETFHQFCSYCTKQIWSTIPCFNCIFAMFCSERCRDKAWNEYHDVECPIIAESVMWGLEHDSLMGLKISTMAVKEAGGINKLESKLKELEAINVSPLTKGFVNGVMDPSKYSSIFFLDTNIEGKRPDQLFHSACVAVIFVYLLATRTEFFGRRIACILGALKDVPNIMFVGGLIFRNLLIVKNNVCMIKDTPTDDSGDRRYIALIPALSLFNHSCFKTTERFDYDEKIALHSIGVIKKGEQVSINYGQKFDSAPKEERQQHIEFQFQFKCTCVACDEAWPTDLSSIPMIPIPASVARKLIETYQLYHHFVKKDEYNGVLYFDESLDLTLMKTQIIEAIEYFDPFVRHPSQDLIMFMSMLETVFISRSNRWQKLNCVNQVS